MFCGSASVSDQPTSRRVVFGPSENFSDAQVSSSAFQVANEFWKAVNSVSLGVSGLPVSLARQTMLVFSGHRRQLASGSVSEVLLRQYASEQVAPSAAAKRTEIKGASPASSGPRSA